MTKEYIDARGWVWHFGWNRFALPEHYKMPRQPPRGEEQPNGEHDAADFLGFLGGEVEDQADSEDEKREDGDGEVHAGR